MTYITVRQSPIYHQMSLEEFLFGPATVNTLISNNTTNTKTYEVERVSERFLKLFDIDELIQILHRFNKSTEKLRNKPRESLFYSFHIPKSSGGLRKIDAPYPELMEALRRLKIIFEEDFKALYHTSAFAYVKGRSTIECMKRHQANESKWFGKFDFHGFFPSTTLSWTMQMFSMVFPFSEVVKVPQGKQELETALSLAFLDGGLPQGTPVSPLITNIMMIPVDFKLAKGFRDFDHQNMIYTRYADDCIISSRYAFKYKEVEKFIVDTLREFNAPFQINEKKTRYGSSAGSNWNLGVVLNKDNKITVGYKNKRKFQAMLTSYILDKQHGVEWDKEDVMTMEGYRNYYRMVEKETIDGMIEHINQKFDVNVIDMIKKDLVTV